MVGHKHNRPMTFATALDPIKRGAAETERPLTLRFRAPVLAPYDHHLPTPTSQPLSTPKLLKMA